MVKHKSFDGGRLEVIDYTSLYCQKKEKAPVQVPTVMDHLDQTAANSNKDWCEYLTFCRGPADHSRFLLLKSGRLKYQFISSRNVKTSDLAG